MCFDCYRCEGSSIPLADEALVRKRKEELKHAQVSRVMAYSIETRRGEQGHSLLNRNMHERVGLFYAPMNHA
jgi:hypothetical protein